jgi:TldD protein
VFELKIARLLEKYPYAEMRREQSRGSGIRISNDEIKVSAGSHYGICVRVLINGSWGFAASNKKTDIKDLLAKAEALAALEKGKIGIVKSKQIKKKIKTKTKTITPDQQVKELLEAKKNMIGKNIISQKISSSDTVTKKEFYNSEGSEIIQEESHTYIGCVCTARDGENVLRGVETAGSRNGFSNIDLNKISNTSREKAQKLLGASTAPRGRFSVVLDPEMSGVFAHEALGHAVEADSIVDRESILSNKIGKKIGSDLISIVDNPSADGFGNYAYDDEGIKAQKTLILEQGVLKNYLNSRETARKTGNPTNGHARASGYDDVPIVRMSNTYVLRGKQRRDEIFDIKKGVYIKGMRGGSVDIFSGGFMFKAEEAYEIKNGECGKILRDAAISGNVLSALKNVEAVGRDFGTSPGMCGKMGQDIPVSDGGPHIRIKNIMVG